MAFRLDVPLTVRIGALGSVEFAPGWYVYTGSARAGIQARVRRHLFGGRRTHWHIDYLRGCVAPVAWRPVVQTSMDECALVAQTVCTLEGRRYPKGFGASDCRCGGHLVQSESAPSWADLG